MKKPPKLSEAVDSIAEPEVRSTTRATASSASATRRVASVPSIVRVSVGMSRYSRCCTVTCPAPILAAVSMKSSQTSSCSAVMRIARKPPKAMETSVRIVRRFWRHRFRHASLMSPVVFTAASYWWFIASMGWIQAARSAG